MLIPAGESDNPAAMEGGRHSPCRGEEPRMATPPIQMKAAQKPKQVISRSRVGESTFVTSPAP